ncbi:MAG TPA: CHAD domain-containing protein [Candidatus Rubrimentiphilum sp.]|nr:CHAD domain-containing protein [Candidatus Rubrimentiphilum sp.]
MNDGVLRRWAHGVITALIHDMDGELAAVRRKPRSAKRVHRARRSMARLEAALADLSTITADACKLQARVHALRRRAGKVRDADVLCKRLNDFGLPAATLRKSLRRRRKRGKQKFCKILREPAASFKPEEPVAGTVRAVPLADSMSVAEANRTIVRIRFAELLAASSALRGEDGTALHALRLTAKRLRYALQRLGAERLHLSETDRALDTFAKTLGAAHDSSVLTRRAIECSATPIAELSRRERRQQIDSARRMWQAMMKDGGPLETLSRYAGFAAV